MKKRVNVTERHTYEIDVDEMLIRIAEGNNIVDFVLGEFGDIVDMEVVLVEIADYPSAAGGEGA